MVNMGDSDLPAVCEGAFFQHFSDSDSIQPAHPVAKTAVSRTGRKNAAPAMMATCSRVVNASRLVERTN